MPVLTRHLYSLDEVVAALQLCLRFRRYDETPFWLWELVRSDETDLAHTTLRQTWLDFGGGWFIHTILSTVAPSSEDTDGWLSLLNTVTQAIELAGSASSVPLMLRTATTPIRPASTSHRGIRNAAVRNYIAALDPAESMTPQQIAVWFAALSCTRDALDAAWLIQAAAPQLSADAIWIALKHIDPTKRTTELLRTAATPHPVSQLQHQITAILLLLGPPAMIDVPIRPCPFSWADYDAKLGRRAGRRFGIPQMALHTETSRGQLPSDETNIDELRDPVPYLPEGCTYWRTVLQTYPGIKLKEGAVVFASASVKEQFYAAQFPDDIPDEWSAADQEKSHGIGYADIASPPPPIPPVREESVANLDTALTIRLL